MGFSGGGSNVLLPHSHDGRVVQDGGPLDFNSITQSQSLAGQVFYSDGVALQQLAYPGVPAGEILTAAAASTAPSWVASASATPVYEEIASTTLGVDTNDITLTFAAVNASDVAQFVFVFNGGVATAGEELQVQVNGSSAAQYYMQRLDMAAGAGAFSQWSGETHWKPYRTQALGARVFGHMNLQVDQTSQVPNILMSSTFIGAAGMAQYSGNVDITATSLSEIKIYAGNSADPLITAGSTASIFKINI